MNDSAKSVEEKSLVADAFRSPNARTESTHPNGLRLRIAPDKELFVERIKPTGWAAVWGLVFPTATVIRLSGKFCTELSIYPSHVRIQKRRWFSKLSVFARFYVSIPVYDEIGDEPVHQLHVRCALAFLYPFVPMHVAVGVDNETLFAQGKFFDSAKGSH